MSNRIAQFFPMPALDDATVGLAALDLAIAGYWSAKRRSDAAAAQMTAAGDAAGANAPGRSRGTPMPRISELRKLEKWAEVAHDAYWAAASALKLAIRLWHAGDDAGEAQSRVGAACMVVRSGILYVVTPSEDGDYMELSTTSPTCYADLDAMVLASN